MFDILTMLKPITLYVLPKNFINFKKYFIYLLHLFRNEINTSQSETMWKKLIAFFPSNFPLFYLCAHWGNKASFVIRFHLFQIYLTIHSELKLYFWNTFNSWLKMKILTQCELWWSSTNSAKAAIVNMQLLLFSTLLLTDRETNNNP